MDAASRPRAHAPGFRELYTPKLVTVLRDGYRPAHLRADLIAGLTVAIVALPLSMAIAIASHVTPERGLFTAIIGGTIIALFGGSRFQVGGPAGAFIVLVAATVDRHGLEGLFLASISPAPRRRRAACCSATGSASRTSATGRASGARSTTSAARRRRSPLRPEAAHR